jgi:4-hydroxy-tetrahydrodipicolinate reductase
MAEQFRVSVNGIMGRMGMQIARMLSNDDSFDIIGGIERKDHPSLGVDIGMLIQGKNSGVRVTDNPESITAKPDCIIDFSTPASTLAILGYARKKKVSMVIGTTGFSKTGIETINQAGKDVAIVISPNMSVLVNLIFKLVELAANVVGDGFDAEIVEAHHKNKIDAPSGTAIKLADIIAHAYNKPLSDTARYERHGQIGVRPRGEIGIQTLRGGDIVGEHTVMFIGTGERLEITHRATSRENFAQGALLAAKWVVRKQPGVYSMSDVLGLTKKMQ